MTPPPAWPQPDETRDAPVPRAPSVHAWTNLAHGRLEPGLTIGGYVVESVLGRGGMGVVLRARAGGPTGAVVALKVMLEVDRRASSYERFAREVEAVRTLDHPGVVRVLGADPRAPVPWIAMELVEGVTLERAFADPKRSLAGRLELVEQVCHAVQHAHERGILHRDLKPANVLVDGTGRVKVADFGLARSVSRSTRLTETGTLLGTPAYLSPESIKGEDTGVPADVWALGVMLYEAVAGCRPFRGGSPVELVRRIVMEDPTPPSSVERRATRAHDRVVLRALAKAPTARHPTVSDLAREIHALRVPPARRRRRAAPSLVLGLGGGAVAVAVVAIVAVVIRSESPPTPTPSAPAPAPSVPAPVAPPLVATEVAPAPPALRPRVELSSHLAAAREALAAFEADAAERAAEAALALAPDSIEARYVRGQARDLLLHRMADDDLQHVLRSTEPAAAPFVYEAWLLMGARAWAAGEVQAAYDHFTRATQVSPRRHEAFARRAMLALYNGGKDTVETCRRDASRAVELAADSVEALRGRAVLAWDDASQERDAARRDVLLLDALALYDQTLAIKADAETLSLRSFVHRDRGDASRKSADQEQALALFDAVRDRATHFSRLARLERERGAVGRAHDAARRAYGENIRHPRALAELGILAAQKALADGDAQREESLGLALANLGWALAVNEHLHEAAVYRARVLLADWSKRDPSRALTDLDRVLAVRPDDRDALALRAEARRLLGE